MKRALGSLLTGFGLSLLSAEAGADTSKSTRGEVNAEANTTNTTNPANSQPSVPRPLSVDFHGPPECGAEARLEQETRALLGDVAETANVRVTARAERTEAGEFQVYLEFSGSVLGKRKLESAECREAIQAAAVILALAINPEALQGQPAEDRASAPQSQDETGNKPSAEGDTKRASEVPVRASRKLSPFLSVEARVSGGVSPAPAFGPQLSFGVDYERLRVLVQGYAEHPGRENLGAESEVRMRAYGVGLRGCGAVIKSAQASAYLCAGLSLSRLIAVPEGLEEEVEQKALLFVPEAGLGLGIMLHPRLALGVRADLLVPTTNPHFTVDEGAEVVTVHQVSVGGAGAVGLTFNLGRRDREP